MEEYTLKLFSYPGHTKRPTDRSDSHGKLSMCGYISHIDNLVIYQNHLKRFLKEQIPWEIKA